MLLPPPINFSMDETLHDDALLVLSVKPGSYNYYYKGQFREKHNNVHLVLCVT